MASAQARPDGYEALLTPLREFSLVAPPLAQALAEAVRALAPLPGIARQLQEAAEARQAAAAGSSARERELEEALAAMAAQMAAAREVIAAGLASLPRDEAYTTAAAHLKELATVSPSLMEWLRQLPAVTLPLGESIGALQQAAEELEAGEKAARRLLER